MCLLRGTVGISETSETCTRDIMMTYDKGLVYIRCTHSTKIQLRVVSTIFYTMFEPLSNNEAFLHAVNCDLHGNLMRFEQVPLLQNI